MRRIVLALILTLTSLSLPVASGVASADSTAARPPISDSGLSIVEFAPGFSSAAQQALANALGVEVTVQYRLALNGFAARLTSGQVLAFQKNRNVVRVSPDYLMTADADSSGLTQPNATWGLDRIDQSTKTLDQKFTYPSSAGSGVEVFVLDTGINPDHTEFLGRVGPGVSYVNDTRGINDCAGHGTHVAGTILGTTWGIAKNAIVRPVRVLNCQGSGTLQWLLNGIEYVISEHDASKTAIANMSLGFNGTVPELADPLKRLKEDNVFLVVAAGNSSANACNTSPANYSGTSDKSAFSVGASDSADKQASFSNFGSCVNIFAPGVSIKSSWYSSATATNTISGTSMASPHVAGVAAVILSDEGNKIPADLATSVLSRTSGNVTLWTSTTTTTKLLAIRVPASSTLLTVPSVTSVSALPGKTSATVTWSTTTLNSRLTYQTVTLFSTGSSRGASYTVAADATSFTASGLKSGTSYYFTVSATNGVGTSTVVRSSNVIAASR